MSDYSVYKKTVSSPPDCTPEISVIIPVYGKAPYLDVALASLQRNTFKKYELIVIADCPDENRLAIIKSYKPDIFIHTRKRLGLSASRNLAAHYAQGEILFFTDDDIELPPDSFEKIHALFQENSQHCVIGVYSLRTKDIDLCTLYKNSWIRFSYLKSPKYVNWFFTAVGAIKKQDWITSSQFQTHYNRKIGGEDIEFGLKLSQSGQPILLEKTLEVKHLRNYSLYELLYNDICRAYGYTLIGFTSRKNFLHVLKSGMGNIAHEFILSSALAGIFSGLSIVAFVFPVWLWVIPGVLAVYLLLNISFYRYIGSNFSLRISLQCIPLMMLDHFVCGCGVTAALCKKVFDSIKAMKRS